MALAAGRQTLGSSRNLTRTVFTCFVRQSFPRGGPQAVAPRTLTWVYTLTTVGRGEGMHLGAAAAAVVAAATVGRVREEGAHGADVR